MKNKLILFFILCCIKISNTHAYTQEEIDLEKLTDAYQKRLELIKLEEIGKRISRRLSQSASPLPNIEKDLDNEALKTNNLEITRKEKELKDLVQLIDREVEYPLEIPKMYWGKYQTEWRENRDKLVILNLHHYEKNKFNKPYEFGLDFNGVGKFKLTIVNNLKRDNQSSTPIGSMNNENESQSLSGYIACGSSFEIKNGIFLKTIEKNKKANWRLNATDSFSDGLDLFFDASFSGCELHFRESGHIKDYVILLKRASTGKTGVLSESDFHQGCLLPAQVKLDKPEDLFLKNFDGSITCSEKAESVELLEDAKEAFRLKIEALLGSQLSDEVIDKADPYIKLDFSKAPRLSEIMISSLVFRHDFYGTIIARLLKWHADHGTKVKILFSSALSYKKDEQLLFELAESSPNIKIREYKFKYKENKISDHVNELHRVMHVKLLILLSEEKKYNAIFIGGRNIHDGFLFKKAPDHSMYPELVQYGERTFRDERFVHWRDFEIRVNSVEVARAMASHFTSLWQQDSLSFSIRPIGQNFVAKRSYDPSYFNLRENESLVRHIISIPYKDNKALERFYIDLINNSKKSLTFTTPYFRPTVKIGRALNRAIERGVEVKLITRIDLKGELGGGILGDVNKDSINRFYKKIKIYEYTEPKVILHSKIFMIDNKLTLIGSVNLNKRSFIHDLESMLMIYNPEFNNKMANVFNNYIQQSRLVDEKQKIAFWKRGVIDILDDKF